MCNLSSSMKAEVLEILKGLTDTGERFTGFSVSRIIREKWGMLQFFPSTRIEISSYVRELFNAGAAPMLGYACMKVAGPGGPVLYFKPDENTRRWAKHIEEEILRKEAEREAAEQGGTDPAA